MPGRIKLMPDARPPSKGDLILSVGDRIYIEGAPFPVYVEQIDSDGTVWVLCVDGQLREASQEAV